MQFLYVVKLCYFKCFYYMARVLRMDTVKYYFCHIDMRARLELLVSAIIASERDIDLRRMEYASYGLRTYDFFVTPGCANSDAKGDHTR